jgi:mRNA interferase RelE/StbE
MTFTVVWTPEAMTAYRQLRIDDRPGAALIAEAVRALADEPRPPSSRRLGTTSFHRLRIEAYRVLYQVDEANAAIVVVHVGRVAGGSH